MHFLKTLRTSLIAVKDSKNIFGVLFFGYDFLLLKRKNSVIVCFQPLHFVANNINKYCEVSEQIAKKLLEIFYLSNLLKHVQFFKPN
jgi:hypothetical protein